MKTFLRLFTISFLFIFNYSFSQNLLVRRNLNTFSDAEISEFVEAIIAMKTRPSYFDPTTNAYDYFPKLHWNAINNMCDGCYHIAHARTGFLNWHREFIRRFEVELKISTNNPTYTLPYWDWTDRSFDSKIFSNTFMGGDGAGRPQDFILYDGPFGKTANRFLVNYNPREKNPENEPSNPADTVYLQRHFGWNPQATTLPTPEDITNALAISTFDVAPYTAEVDPPNQSFRQSFEGFDPVPWITPTIIGYQNHNRVHIYIGGNFVSDASPNDPIFWVHHAFIDKIFSDWLDRHGIDKFPTTWTDNTDYSTMAKSHSNHSHHGIPSATSLITLHDTDLMEPFGVSFRSMLKSCELGYIYDNQITNSTITTSISSGTHQFFETGSIIGISQVINPANVTFKAGKSILLSHGFSANSGSVFMAQINGCK